MAQQYERERISLYKEKIQSIWNFFVNFAVCLDPRMLVTVLGSDTEVGSRLHSDSAKAIVFYAMVEPP